jgi:hypothetical protein
MADLPDVDLTALTTAIAKVAEDMVRTIAQDTVPALLKQQVEESLIKMVPSLVEAAVAEEKVLIRETVEEVTRKALPDLLRPMIQQMVPSLVEAAVAEEKVLIRETAQEITRKALPDLLRPMVPQLAEAIIEKVARDVVGAKAETEIKKEIERLTAEA